MSARFIHLSPVLVLDFPEQGVDYHPLMSRALRPSYTIAALAGAVLAMRLIVPNLATLVTHLHDKLLGVMTPYFASAFGVFLMRQTFRAIPRDFEEAAMLDGASIPVLIRHVLLPLARPGLVAFAIVSVTAHWNEFLWPLMAVSSPRNQVLTVGLAS
jgi:sn-glycerol 3-phosphate transport system permease protein